MSHDLNYAASGLIAELDRVLSALEGMALHRDLVDLEALEMAMFDVENAKAAILLALCGKDVAH
jgi:Ni,Fe-hydrogenase III large subunit